MIAPPLKNKCCESCFDLPEKYNEMSLVIEILKSQIDFLQAYVNTNKPSSPVNDSTVLIKNLKSQLVSLNDRNKRLEEEILTMRKYYLDKITKDNANDTKGIEVKQSGDINLISDRTLLEQNSQTISSQSNQYAHPVNQIPLTIIPPTPWDTK